MLIGLLSASLTTDGWTWDFLGVNLPGKDVVEVADWFFAGCRCDDKWRMQFHEASIEHLVKRRSYHNPLLLRCCNVVLGEGVVLPGFKQHGVPMRHIMMWCARLEKDREHIPNALRNVIDDSLTFNNETFGNIFEKKKAIEVTLRGI